jgi:predicted ester cyclase
MDAPRQVVAQLVDALNAHDVGGACTSFAGGARVVLGSGRTVDPTGLADTLRDTFAAFPDLRLDVRRWVVEGELVVTEEVMEGTHKGPFAGLAPTGRRIRLAIAHVTRVVDGRIVERVAYHDTAGVLRQLA